MFSHSASFRNYHWDSASRVFLSQRWPKARGRRRRPSLLISVSFDGDHPALFVVGLHLDCFGMSLPPQSPSEEEVTPREVKQYLSKTLFPRNRSPGPQGYTSLYHQLKRLPASSCRSTRSCKEGPSECLESEDDLKDHRKLPSEKAEATVASSRLSLAPRRRRLEIHIYVPTVAGGERRPPAVGEGLPSAPERDLCS